MHSHDFNLNRPVHMARRDAFFEGAMDLLNVPTEGLETAERLTHINRVLELLTTSVRHANFAVKSVQATSREKDFLHFLELISNNVQSAQAMIQHQSHFEGEEGFLSQFLNARPEESAQPAGHYRRRADDIFQGLWHLLRLAHQPYRELRQAALATLNPSESDRYRRACESAREELAQRP